MRGSHFQKLPVNEHLASRTTLATEPLQLHGLAHLRQPGPRQTERREAYLHIPTGHHEKHHLFHIQLLKLFNGYNNILSSYKMNILLLGINWQHMKYYNCPKLWDFIIFYFILNLLYI